MTPVEIFEYKLSWKDKAHVVYSPCVFEYMAKDWCRNKLESHQWDFKKLADNYMHAFLFEDEKKANMFNCIFGE